MHARESSCSHGSSILVFWQGILTDQAASTQITPLHQKGWTYTRLILLLIPQFINAFLGELKLALSQIPITCTMERAHCILSHEWQLSNRMKRQCLMKRHKFKLTVVTIVVLCRTVQCQCMRDILHTNEDKAVLRNHINCSRSSSPVSKSSKGMTIPFAFHSKSWSSMGMLQQGLLTPFYAINVLP